MKVLEIKVFLKLVLIVAVLLIFNNSLFAHPSSQTPYPSVGHFDVYGKITAPNGSVLPLPSEAKVTANTRELVGNIMPSHCLVNNEASSSINPTTGEYHLIIYIATHLPECREAFNKPPILTDKIKITAPGYYFKRKGQ